MLNLNLPYQAKNLKKKHTSVKPIDFPLLVDSKNVLVHDNLYVGLLQISVVYVIVVHNIRVMLFLQL